MTPEAQNTLLLWMFGGLAVIGVYVLIVFPALFIWHKLAAITTPLPDAKTDALIQQLNGESRWRKQ